MKVHIFTGIIIVLGIVLTSCEKNNINPVTIPASCNTTNITYSNTIDSIVRLNCAYTRGCHAPHSPYADLSTYDNLKAYADNGSLYQQLFILKRMPPAPQSLLDNCQQAQVKAWISAGAPK